MDGGRKSSPPLAAAPAKRRRSKKSKRRKQDQRASPSDTSGASNDAATPKQEAGARSDKASQGSPYQMAHPAEGKKSRRQSTSSVQHSSVKPPLNLGAAVSDGAGPSPKAADTLSSLTPSATPYTCGLEATSLAPRKAHSPSSQNEKEDHLDDPSLSGPAETKDKSEQHFVEERKPGRSSGRGLLCLLPPIKGEQGAEAETSGPSALCAKEPVASRKDEKPEAPAEASPKPAFARHTPKKPLQLHYNALEQLASSHRAKPQQHSWDISALQQPPRFRKDAAIVAGIVLVTFALLYWQHWKTTPKPSSRYNTCTTQVCYRHPTFFKDSLNYSADPCVDFDAFTCSQWKPSAALSPSYVVDLSQRHMQRMARLLLHGHPHYNASASAAAFLRKCLEDSGDLSGLDQFREFARGIGIPWPYVPQSPGQTKSVHPLHVVFELSARWRIHTWFSVMQSALRTKGTSAGAFYIDETIGPSELLNIARTLEENNARELYYRQFCDLYKVTVPGSTKLRRLLNVEMSVLTTLDTVRTAKRLVISALLPSHLGNLASNVTQEEWVDLVRHFAPNVQAPERFIFYLSNMAIIDAVDEIFASHEHADIMEHLSWWLTQEYAVLGTPKALDILAENREDAKRVVHVGCYNVVAQKFAALLFAERAVTQFSATEREQVSRLLRRLVGLAKKFARLLPWTEAGFSYVERKLRDLEVLVWPEGYPDLDDALSAMYADFLVVDGVTNASFMDYWLQASKALLAMSDYKWVQLTWRLPDVGIFANDYWNNQLIVLEAALYEPLYYPNNVDLQAANLGGLGASFLSRVLRILNPSVISADVNGKIADLFTKRGARLYLETRECGPSYSHLVKELISLAAAWSEFERARPEETSGQASPILNIQSFREIRSFTDRQVFFLTYCRTLCTTRSSHACNPVLKHLDAFGTAFQCENGAPMRSRDHCGLLQVVNDALKNQSWLQASLHPTSAPPCSGGRCILPLV